jgi:hypothetical protein
MTKTFIAVLTAVAALAVPGQAFAGSTPSDPTLTVSQSLLNASIRCHGPSLVGATRTPIILVSGTGGSGEELYGILQGAFDRYQHPICTVDFPNKMMGDVQVSAQYLANAIRYVNTQSAKKVAIYGLSQGGMLPRWVLTWWPSLRNKVDDVVAVAGTQHGSTNTNGFVCDRTHACPAAVWQQASTSNLLGALNRYPDETPGNTSWTTVYSTTDEVVQPQTGLHPTSALVGATNISIQSVCPGRKVTHIGSALDSVAWGAFVDAVGHAGPALVSRLPANKCSRTFGDGLNDLSSRIAIFAAPKLIQGTWATAPKVSAEPALASYVK